MVVHFETKNIFDCRADENTILIEMFFTALWTQKKQKN
jgi:hypothetical protein